MNIPRALGILLLSVTSEVAFSQQEYASSTHVYKTVGDHGILIDVFTPTTRVKKPAILFIHGGALILGSRQWILPWQRQMYLDAGFVLASIDYRLAPETKLPEIHSDVESAYHWLRAEGPRKFNIDPDRISVVGYSAGGYLALVAGYRLEPRPRAVVSFYGYGDITGEWYSEPNANFFQDGPISERDARSAVGDTTISGTPLDMEHRRGDFYVWSRQHGTWPVEVSGHDPRTDSDWFRSYEPIHNVTPDYPPTLLLHGGQDTDVPLEQSLLLSQKLQQQNVVYQLVTDKNWGHMFDGPEKTHKLTEVFNKIIEFLTSNSP
jgi:acetyl esterase/lipase